MSDQWEKAQQFKDSLKRFFEDKACEKTSWGKNEVAARIEELWAEFLLRHLG